MTYYLKYRPQKIDELDLENVRESLKKIVKSGKIPHAFLFSGPKGGGKTSAARILAKIVNCEKRRKNSIEPCNKCSQCKLIKKGANIDVIELDAASHRGIDDVRALRDAVKLAPAKAKKKVYIVDEAHMLTTEASNALLKTLEEPPGHVMFILATTNPEKLIATIRSRTQNLVFGKANLEEIVRSLLKKVKGEKLKVDEHVLKLIARASDGAFRDADKILEQMVTEKIPLKKDEVEEFLFQRKTIDVDKFLSLLAEKNVRKAIEEVEKVATGGASMRTFLEVVLSRLRTALLAKVGVGGEDLDEFSKQDLILLIKLFSEASREVPTALIEQIPIEIAIVEWCQSEVDRRLDDGGRRDLSTGRTSGVKSVRSAKRRMQKNKQEVKNFLRKDLGERQPAEISDDVWMTILSKIKPRNTTTEALLRAAKPVKYDGRTLELGVFYRFHKERLESVQHKLVLEEVISEVLGGNVEVLCMLTEPPRKIDRKVGNESEGTNVGPVSRESSQTGLAKEARSDLALTEADDEDIIKVAKEIFGS